MTALPEILPAYLVVACLPCLLSICDVFDGCREVALTCLTSVSWFLTKSGFPVFSLAGSLAYGKDPASSYICNSSL